MNARLLISLSGVTPWTVHQAAELLADLDRRGTPVTHLVCPRAAERSPTLTEWVKDRARRGDGVLMHGYDQALIPTPRSGYLRRSSEFATLPAHEANLRLTAAARVLERIDLRVDGFAPPRWVASAGTLSALRGHQWPLCADAVGIYDLRTGAIVRSRVMSMPVSPQRTEALRCYALVSAASRAVRRGGVLRLAIDVADLLRPLPRQAFLDAADVARDGGAAPTTYAALLPAAAAA